MPKRSTATCECSPGPRPVYGCSRSASALRYRGMGRLFIAAHSAPVASRVIRRLAARTDVYVGVCLRTRRAGGRDAIDRSHLAFVEIDTPDALDRLRGFQHPSSGGATAQNRAHRDRHGASGDPSRRVRARARGHLARPQRQDPLPIPPRPHGKPPALRGRHVVLLRRL